VPALFFSSGIEDDSSLGRVMCRAPRGGGHRPSVVSTPLGRLFLGATLMKARIRSLGEALPFPPAH